MRTKTINAVKIIPMLLAGVTALTCCLGLAAARELAFLEPPDGYVYHGVSPHVPDVEAYIAALGDPALYPAVEGMHAAVPGTRPRFWSAPFASFWRE